MLNQTDGDRAVSGTAASSLEIRVSLNWCPPVLALLDSGAQVNVISSAYVRAMCNKAAMSMDVSETLTAVDGRPLSVEGVLFVPVRVAGTLLHPPSSFLCIKRCRP